MKRIILLILINFWVADNISCMDKPPSSAPLVSNHPIVPPQIQLSLQFGIFLDEKSLDELIKEANKGNPELEYLLGSYYYYGLTPAHTRDFKQAEQWFLKAQKKDYLPAYLKLIDLAMDLENEDKWIRYTSEAIARGFLDQNYNLAAVFLKQKKYSKAQKALEKTIESLEPYQDNPKFTWVRDLAQVQLANLFKKGHLGFKDIQKAVDTFTVLSAKKNIHAMHFLALWNLENNNTREALNLLLKLESIGEPTNSLDKMIYYRSLIILGSIYEKSPYSNIKKAIEYYKKSYSYGGRFHEARLILTKKIPGDMDYARKLLREGSEGNDPNLLAAYLYGTILIAEGQQSQGILLLEKVDKQNTDMNPLISLQLGIAYHYGFGVEQDEKKSRDHFQKILNDPDTSYRSLLLARGYLYLFGLGGVKKDIAKGLALINESENKLDDVYFETDQLLPAISKLRAEQAAVMQKELIGQEPEKKVKKKKKRAAESTLPVVEEPEDDPFQTTEKEWNEYFAVDDGSYVSLIDKKNKVFIINDPKRDQQLIVKFENLPARDLTDIAALKYHKRILERQGYTKRRLKHTTKYNHDFAEMLDYVIQYLGEYVPFAKDGSDKHDDQIIATVIRKDLKTGKEVINKAEYTFGQKGDEVYVYHRLLRPIKVAMP